MATSVTGAGRQSAGLDGTIHQVAAWHGGYGTWTEPLAALVAAAQGVGLTIRRNKECLWALRLPSVDPELSSRRL